MTNCLVCDEVIQENFTSLFNCSTEVCYECFNKFKIRNSKFVINGVKGIILYYYDEFFKNLLYKYKGCYDYALKDVFRDVSALYDSALREQYEAAKKDAEEGKSAPVVEKSEEEK